MQSFSTYHKPSIIIVGLSLLFLTQACEHTSAPPTMTTRIVQTDMVSNDQIPTFDSLTLYVKYEEDWGLAINISRADSLAGWLAHNKLDVIDMWFPTQAPICFRTYFTWNIVYLRLEHPDTSLSTLGFQAVNGLDLCFRSWKHYKFVESSTN